MPPHSDFQKVNAGKKSESVFRATIRKKKLDKTKPLKKEFKISNKKVSFKEAEGEFYTSGPIATTHVDSVNDKIQVETLHEWANKLNSTEDFDAKPTSLHHDRDDLTLVGLGGNAEVRAVGDGEFGLFVNTHHNKSHENFDNIVYQVENDFLTHYSIEYDTEHDASTHREVVDGKSVRVIEPGTKLLGYGLASPRTVVNKNASITEAGYKELLEVKMKDKKEDSTEDKPEEPKEEPKSAPEEGTPAKEAPKEDSPGEPKAEESEDKEKVKEFQEYKSFLKHKAKVDADVKEEMKETKPSGSPLLNKGNKMENKERKLEKKELQLKEHIVSFKEGVLASKSPVSEQWRIAANVEKDFKERGLPIHTGDYSAPFEITDDNRIAYKENPISRVFEGKEFERKDVTTDTDYVGTQTTFIAALANYEQSPARYNDIYGPVIVNQLNDETSTWNLLQKENMSGMSAIRIRARTGRNSTAGHYAYGSTPGWDGNVTLNKFNQHFITSYVEVAAEFEAIEFGRGAGGIDVYASEIQYSTRDLMTYLNDSNGIFGTGDGTSETAPLGLDGGLIRTSGNLYGIDVTSVTTLAAAGRDAMSSAAITLKKLRAMIRTCVTNGARRDDLFFVTSYLQHDFIKALIQDQQRIVPTSARVGFTGLIELDGVAIFPEKDLDANSMTDDVFLLDRAHTKIGIKKAPTYVEFGLTELRRKGIIWMMWNLYSDAPNHNYQINGLATS